MIQKAIYSQWSSPFGNTTGAFLNHETARASWCISVENSKKFFKSVELVCDDAAKKTLVDEFGIPFDKVHNVLDESLKGMDPAFWVMGKFHAYRMQAEPFIHIDSDFIFFDKMQDELLKAPFVFANPETITGTYISGMQVLKNCPVKPSYYDPKLCFDNLCCVGVIGVNDLATMKEWVDSIFEVVTCSRNKEFWMYAGYRGRHVVCWLLEQYMIANLLKVKNIQPMFLTDHFTAWTHLLGGSKRDPEVTQSLVKRYQFQEFIREYNTKKIHQLKPTQVDRTIV
jgi:hypothetical protein